MSSGLNEITLRRRGILCSAAPVVTKAERTARAGQSVVAWDEIPVSRFEKAEGGMKVSIHHEGRFSTKYREAKRHTARRSEISDAA